MALRSGLRLLDLCAGVGMLGVAVKIACRAVGIRVRTVGYIERQAYAAATLVARMADATLDTAPLWDDVATFDGRAWRHCVDIITAGYPCQPFSVAGQRRGTRDHRHLWPDLHRVIGETEPRIVFLENVPGHLGLGYGRVRRDLEGSGFRVTEGLFSAEEVGASNRRIRLFVLAHAKGDGAWRRFGDKPKEAVGWGTEPDRECSELADPTECQRKPGRSQARERTKGQGVPNADDPGEELADADDKRPPERAGLERDPSAELAPAQRGSGVFVPGPDDREAWASLLQERPDLEPALRLCADGTSADVDGLRIQYRTDQLCAVGNTVCPLAAANAFLQLAACLVFGEG